MQYLVLVNDSDPSDNFGVNIVHPKSVWYDAIMCWWGMRILEKCVGALEAIHFDGRLREAKGGRGA